MSSTSPGLLAVLGLLDYAFLAAVFGASGAAKLRKPVSVALAMFRFGLIRRVRPAWGAAAGAAECVAAVALLVAVVALPGRWLLALPAFLLCVAFTALIGRALWRGERFSCNCFGESSAPISRLSLGRAAALALLCGPVGVALASATDTFGGPRERVLVACAGALAACGAFAVGALARLRPFSVRLGDA